MIFTTVIYTSIQEFLRFSSFTILNFHLHSYPDQDQQKVPHTITFHHPIFITTYYLAFGWALAEATALMYQSFSQLLLYKDVLPPSSSDITGSVVTPGIGFEFGFGNMESAGARYVHGMLERNNSGHGHEHHDRADKPSSKGDYGTMTMTVDRGRPAVRRASDLVDTRDPRDRDDIGAVVDPPYVSLEHSTAADAEAHRNGFDASVAVENDDENRNDDDRYKAINMIGDDEDEAHQEEDVADLLDEEITRLVNVKKREELEEVYGVAFVVCKLFLRSLLLVLTCTYAIRRTSRYFSSFYNALTLSSSRTV